MPNFDSNGADRTDGRVERGRQTRARIIDAVLELAEEGEAAPTVAKIAARVGISARLVHHHFGSIEDIIDKAIDHRLQELIRRQPRLPTHGPVQHRIAALVAARADALEWITPLRLTTVRLEQQSAKLRRCRDTALAIAGTQLETVFETELSAQPEERRRLLLAALGTATSWEAWHHLRFANTPEQAQQIMALTVESLLAMGGRERPVGEEHV
ncbi:TetR/AcrR family transcriptional regulator [Streptomyces sp. NPDC047022]|uniref:TetR/AcrR family transcriptional regulator n=1 Tax=Streptomyces sp. NPDC047022 TaxID=3155737 RepID=UPI0033C0AD97